MKYDQLEFVWDAAGKAPELASPPLPAAPEAASQPAARNSAPWLSVEKLQARANELHRELSAQVAMPLVLRITNNRSTMMSLRYSPDGKQARLSLHHMFLEAGPEVRRALAHWVKKPRAHKPGVVLNSFIREQSHHIAPARPRTKTLRHASRYHDIVQYYHEINERHFNNRVTAPITWGNMPRLRRRTSIRFGSYSPKEHIIRMHPLLDQAFVPEFFVRYIVFHEMLHADLGIEELSSGRRAIHSRAFKEAEKQYPEYERALTWMQQPANLDLLLRAQRTR